MLLQARLIVIVSCLAMPSRLIAEQKLIALVPHAFASQVEGLCFVTESYGPGGHLARHMKVTVADLEIRDCALQVRMKIFATGVR